MLTNPDSVAEAAVVGISDELTGQAVNAFVALKDGTESSDQVKKDLILQVRKSIGPFAAPKAIFVVPDLPKTRSGKIMRRIMRKILAGEEDQLGDITTVSFLLFSRLRAYMVWSLWWCLPRRYYYMWWWSLPRRYYYMWMTRKDPG